MPVAIAQALAKDGILVAVPGKHLAAAAVALVVIDLAGACGFNAILPLL